MRTPTGARGRRMYCRNCGNTVTEGAVVCLSCGAAPLKGNKHCQNCGKETDPLADVCLSCGTPLSGGMLATPAGGDFMTRNVFGTEQKSKLVAGVLGILLGWLGI